MVTILKNQKQTDTRVRRTTLGNFSMQKLPYILVVGDKEKEAGAVAVRARGNQDLGVMSLEAFSQKIASDISLKS